MPTDEYTAAFMEELDAVFVPSGKSIQIQPGGVCCHNRAVTCSEYAMCYRCGWNPAVEHMRKARNRRMFGVAQKKD